MRAGEVDSRVEEKDGSGEGALLSVGLVGDVGEGEGGPADLQGIMADIFAEDSVLYDPEEVLRDERAYLVLGDPVDD